MLILVAMAFLTAAANGANAAPPPAALSVQDKAYTLLRDGDLLGALPGKAVFDPDCASTSRCTDSFSADGHSYEMSGDRANQHGTYTILADRYCMTIRDQTWCKALFRAGDGSYAELPYRDRWGGPTRVKVAPLQR